MMSGILAGRVAIVTGAARGIGLAVAQTMVMQGARVVIADNGASIDGSPEDSVVADAAAERCNAIAAGRAVAFKDDIAAPGAAQRLVETARDAFGAVDVVVNNAAIRRTAPLLEARQDAFEHVIGTNLIAAFALLAAAAPMMRDQVRGGRIPGAVINVVSTAGLYGRAGEAAYASAKAALLGLTRVAALELQPTGVTCNAVAPFAATRAAQAGAEPGDDVPARALLRRAMGVPASYAANLIAWLGSPQAASVTGQLFGVRGRELMLFSQPRPVRTVFTDPGGLDPDALAGYVLNHLAPDFTALTGDLDAFGSEPVV